MQNELAMAGKHDALMEESRATKMPVRTTASEYIHGTTVQADERTANKCSHTSDVQYPNPTKQENQEEVQWTMPSLWNTGTNGRNAENASEKNHKPNLQLKSATANPIQSNSGEQNEIQLRTRLPNMWQGGKLRPRLLLQDYGYISISKCPVT